ncbi:MAG: enolase C-terminal domain-like protein [Spirochaetia bacterium]
MKIKSYDIDIRREPLVRPFTFKAGQFTEKWIIQTTLVSDTGAEVTGIGSAAILWSDPAVFAAYSETGGNILMTALAEEAARVSVGMAGSSPLAILDQLVAHIYSYGKRITGNENLRQTFALNSLISLDNALWKLYALENNIQEFDALLPATYSPAFSSHQKKLVCIPLITYTFPLNEIRKLVQDGHYFIKIKIGQAGSQQEMLEKDKQRIQKIFDVTRENQTPYTENGKIAYYLDANGRYESKSAIQNLLDYAADLGMLEQIAVLEEPFPEEMHEDVSDLPVRISADESLHSVTDVFEKIDKGYGAITLKPAGKTLSMSLRMGKAAFDRNVPCYVADSTCIPELVEWNKNIAARLSALPGQKTGSIESNGAQFYKNWQKMMAKHPYAGSRWTETEKGFFHLDSHYYRTAGGILTDAWR